MYTLDIPLEKWVTPQSSVQFRVKYHLNREMGGGGSPLKREVSKF